MAAIHLSLKYGAGDLHWFDNLTREDQVLVVAYDQREPVAEPVPQPVNQGQALIQKHLARVSKLKGGAP